MPPRDLRESAEFTEQLQKLGDWARLDDILLGLIYAIARHPSDFPAVDEKTNVRLAKSISFGNSPSLRLLFRIVDETVIELIAIAPVEDE